MDEPRTPGPRLTTRPNEQARPGEAPGLALSSPPARPTGPARSIGDTMPAPYITAAELIQQAHANHTHPYEHALDIADGHGWEPDHTIEALHAIRRTMENLPQPQPHHAIALADEFAKELNREDDRETLTLAETIASFLTTLTAYEQSGDPSEADALATLEADLARMVGLAPDDDDDTDRP